MKIPIDVTKFDYPRKLNDGTQWIHINLHFNEKFESKDLRQLKRFVLIIYGRIYTLIDRSFYLIPTGKFLMFSAEVRFPENIKLIERILSDLENIYIKSKEIKFISSVEIETDTDDYKNGDGYLMVMNAIMNFNLLYEDHSPTHLIHTIINSMLLNKGKEREFYKIMEKIY